MPQFPDRPSAESAHGGADAGWGPWVAGVVPVEVVLARNDVAAVVLRSIRARPTGFVMSVTAYWRGPPQVNGAWSGGAEIPSAPLDESVTNPFPGGWGYDGLDNEGRLHPMYLRFGLLFADGGGVENIDYNTWRREGTKQPPAYGMTGLRGYGSGAGGVSFHEAQYAVWPLPAAPTLQVVCEWPAFDIPQATVDIDVAPIHEAAARARRVWEA